MSNKQECFDIGSVVVRTFPEDLPERIDLPNVMKRPRPRPLSRRVAVLCALSAGVVATSRELGTQWNGGRRSPAGLSSRDGGAEETSLRSLGETARIVREDQHQQHLQRQQQHRHESVGKLPHIAQAAATRERTKSVSYSAQAATRSSSAASTLPSAGGPYGMASSQRRALSTSSSDSDSATAVATVSASASASTATGLTGSSSASATASATFTTSYANGKSDGLPVMATTQVSCPLAWIDPGSLGFRFERVDRLVTTVLCEIVTDRATVESPKRGAK